MEKALSPLRITTTQRSARDAKKHSVSFVVSVMWMVYAISLAYIKVWFFDTGDSVYYIQIIPMLCISAYQVYYLLKDVDIGKSRLNLFVLYCAFITLHYLILRSGLERVLRLMALLIGLMTFKKYKLKNRELGFLYYLFAIVVLLKVLNGTTVENMADKSKFNPTECAIYLMLLWCISIVMFATKKQLRHLLIAAISIGLQFVFTSRGALAGCLLFFVLFVLLKAWKKSCKVKFAFAALFILSVLSILAAYFYSVVLFEAIGRGKIIILGKDLFTGRQKIWAMTFDTIKNNLWFGVGSHVNESYIMEFENSLYRNAHNQALATLVSFGVIHFVLFYLTLAYIIAYNGAYGTRKQQRVPRAPIVFMIVITLMSYFEALYFYQLAMPMILVAYGFICGATPVRKTVAALPDKKRACHG